MSAVQVRLGVSNARRLDHLLEHRGTSIAQDLRMSTFDDFSLNMGAERRCSDSEMGRGETVLTST